MACPPSVQDLHIDVSAPQLNDRKDADDDDDDCDVIWPYLRGTEKPMQSWGTVNLGNEEDMLTPVDLNKLYQKSGAIGPTFFLSDVKDLTETLISFFIPSVMVSGMRGRVVSQERVAAVAMMVMGRQWLVEGGK